MKTYLDCIPCFARQILSAARLATDDPQVHTYLLREGLTLIGTMDMSQPPPLMGQAIHKLIRETIGSDDPYKAVKEQFNRLARDVYPELKKRVALAENPLETALRIAIAGNIIDFGARESVQPSDVLSVIEQSFSVLLLGDFAQFEKAVCDAASILYLCDNTGEIVLDRLLVEQLGPDRVIVVVRGGPVINDATFEDAQYAGLTDIVRVIDNGADIPGTVISECSNEFVRYFESADLIIAKGQGNYETLSDSDQETPIFFLFQTKCDVAARDVGCEKGRFVILPHHLPGKMETVSSKGALDDK